MEELEFEFFDLLKKHDFWYAMAEGTPYYRGRDERRVINKQLKEYPSLTWIYDRFTRAVLERRTPLSLEELRRD